MEPAKFRWRGFQEEQYAEFPEHYSGGVVGTITSTVDFAYDADHRIVACRVVVDFSQKNALYLRCGFTSVFEIDADSWEARTDRKKMEVRLERELHIHFAVFTIGGLRGYLHARQQSSSVSALLMPVNILDSIPEYDNKIIQLNGSK